MMEWSIPIFVAIPLFFAFILPIAGRKSERVGDVLANIGTLTTLIFAILNVKFMKETSVYYVGGWKLPMGIYLVRDALTIFMLITVNLVAFMSTLFSINYMQKFTDKTKYYALFMLMLAGMNGVIITGDFFNLYVFLEIAAIASYALVAYGIESEELESAFKYQVMGSVGSAFILLAIILIYSHTGTLNMADVGKVLQEKGLSNLLIFVSVLFIVGFGIKAGVIPFHAWLPDAHPSAPAPISAMLSGAAIKVMGIYPLIRIIYNVIGFNELFSNILMILAVISIIMGDLLALLQWDYKRLLAYSSISHIGFILLAVGLGTPLGILAGLFHLFNHSVIKALLFLNSGSIVYSAGTRDLKEMGGLDKDMPVTSKTNLIGSMSIAGIPPFNGFWSKLLIIVACITAGKAGYAWWAIAGSIITLAVFAKAYKYAFCGESKKKVKESPAWMCIAMIILAIICVAGGLLLLPEVKVAFLNPVVEVIRGGLQYIDRVLGGLQ